MKIIYSELKKLLPGLTVSPKQLRDDLTSIGHFVSGFEQKDGETILDLEIRQNRADCLGYYGIALDLSVLYYIPFSLLPPTNTFTDKPLPIEIKSNDVHRIMATSISGLKIAPSPLWLVKLLSLHGINPINNLVDITNYAMLISGIPCHAFDTAKSPKLIWENNEHFADFTSLDGSKLKLQPGNLVIHNHTEVLSLSFIGGQNSNIDSSTTSTIIEMALYTPARVRSDSRNLKTITEASIRLDKFLDTETIPMGFNFLVDQILKLCGGKINGQLLDIYPQKPTPVTISLDLQKPSLYAGIDIPAEFSLDCLKALGCTTEKNLVIPPTIRKDLNIEEDLIEEIIRFYGYDKIPVDQPIDSRPLPDITPPILHQIEKLKDDLIAQGYDEIRSWPLVSAPLDPHSVIKTQNSINSDFPYLRQSIIQSLKNQLDQYQRFKLPHPKFFEFGKIFFQQNGNYTEKYALGTFDGQNFSETVFDDTIEANAYQPSPQTNSAIELNSQIITLDANVNYDSPQDSSSLLLHYISLIDPKILWSIEIADIYQNRYTFRVSYYNCDDKIAKKTHLSTFNLNSR